MGEGFQRYVRSARWQTGVKSRARNCDPRPVVASRKNYAVKHTVSQQPRAMQPTYHPRLCASASTAAFIKTACQQAMALATSRNADGGDNADFGVLVRPPAKGMAATRLMTFHAFDFGVGSKIWHGFWTGGQ